MNILIKNIGFMSKFKNMDMKSIVQKAIDFNMSYFALRVMDGQRAVNVLTENGNNNILEKIIQHANSNGLKVAAYVTIFGGDVQIEFNRLVTRIEKYIPNICAIIIEVTDAWSIRKPEEAIKYVGLLRNKYPNMPIILFDNTNGNICMSTWASLVDQIMVISGASWTTIVNKYLQYWRYKLWNGFDDLDKIFVPVLGICDIPNHNYIFKDLSVRNLYNLILKSKFNACGLFDWTPNNVSGLGDDGSNIDRTIRDLVWTKQLTFLDEEGQVIPVPDIPDTPIVPEIKPEFYSFTEERFNEVYRWFKEQKGE